MSSARGVLNFVTDVRVKLGVKETKRNATNSVCPLYQGLATGEPVRLTDQSLIECLRCSSFPDCWKVDHFLRLWNLARWGERRIHGSPAS